MSEFLKINDSVTEKEIVNHHQYLTFLLGDDIYGVDILRVQEVRGWTKVRKIPNTPDYVKGVLDLRGTIVPIVDLRVRLSLEQVEYSTITVVIVLSVEVKNENYVIGIVVDTVSDVLDVVETDIKKAPNFGTRVETKFISGMVMTDSGMIVLMDIDKMLNPDELTALKEISE
ncbi:MAG: chemotaxis protein CheW [Gammaproteobacteria bacterium]|nr:chemotaxis protein CheW [Gammaproteobacteria bacterium]